MVNGEDYRIEINTLINKQFLEYVIKFFQEVVKAKFNDQTIDENWYTKHFLNSGLDKVELLNNSGLNMKTVANQYQNTKKATIIVASQVNHQILLSSIQKLIEQSDVDITLTIKYKTVSVDLSLSESLLVINALAVTRASMAGGAWSAAGKNVEVPLMDTICFLIGVSRENYFYKGLSDQKREVDFHFINRDGKDIRCEIKLMGKGNPESADAAFARGTDILIADSLSLATKTQLTLRNIQWVELRSEKGFRTLSQVLSHYGVPHTPFDGNLNEALNLILQS